ncbi:uncharacterized protein PSFLO_03741 [Pseudozyma flocculosa]|uniref:Uncharacterized protein n=1 Tax=Pseudozyma flocculosa TaxID=84751 RepID=A0A5C3F166_9BASI|nr:uncharacterized protein PSFLO_03741 [Pseudozyma flocculosa]
MAPPARVWSRPPPSRPLLAPSPLPGHWARGRRGVACSQEGRRQGAQQARSSRVGEEWKGGSRTGWLTAAPLGSFVRKPDAPALPRGGVRPSTAGQIARWAKRAAWTEPAPDVGHCPSTSSSPESESESEFGVVVVVVVAFVVVGDEPTKADLAVARNSPPVSGAQGAIAILRISPEAETGAATRELALGRANKQAQGRRSQEAEAKAGQRSFGIRPEKTARTHVQARQAAIAKSALPAALPSTKSALPVLWGRDAGEPAAVVTQQPSLLHSLARPHRTALRGAAGFVVDGASGDQRRPGTLGQPPIYPPSQAEPPPGGGAEDAATLINRPSGIFERRSAPSKAGHGRHRPSSAAMPSAEMFEAATQRGGAGLAWAGLPRPASPTTSTPPKQTSPRRTSGKAKQAASASQGFGRAENRNFARHQPKFTQRTRPGCVCT